MNTTSSDPTAPPPPPPQPPRSSFSCDRHPNEQFNGFCPSCLCERLTTLDTSTSNTPSSSRRPSSVAAAAIKSLFSSTSKLNNSLPPKPSKPTSFLPELRRSKSFSASKNEALGLFFEPQRKSCDVRVRSTLSTLFTLDKDTQNCANNTSKLASVSGLAFSSDQNHQNDIKIESFVANKPVFEESEHEEVFRDPEYVEDSASLVGNICEDGDKIRPVQDVHLDDLRNVVEIGVNSGEIVKQEEVNITSLKPMKDHIDLDTRDKKGGGFWAAASVFSKKWQNWRGKHKIKKHNNGENLSTAPVEKPISRQFRETQSEIADYGFGRRSCDIDPRFSLDAGRISFDDTRCSFDEPRPSWDGHLIGRTFPRMAPMVSVMEDAPAVTVSRPDMRIPVEEPNVPGGSTQTRDYYLDSSTKRRKSLDRSNSVRSNATKVSPDYFHGANLRDDCCETFELSSAFRDRDSINSVIWNNGESKESKRSKRWSWRMWGFIQRRNKDEKCSGVNGVERSLSESWSGDVRGGINRNMFRSNSSVSWRNNGTNVVRKSNVEMNVNKRNEFVLEKNRSARYSPKDSDNGLLRFYVTPLGSSRRGGGLSQIKPNNSHSIARSVLRLY